MLHASRRTYYAGCRCQMCVDAHAYYKRAMRKQRRERLAREVPDHVHGTVNGYNNYNCRCDRCMTAYSEFCTSATLVPES